MRSPPLSRREWLGGAGAAALLAQAVPGFAQAPSRLALVIGNGNYSAAGKALTCPPADAAAVAERLSALGFAVERPPELTSRTLGPTIAAFGRRVRAAGEQAVAFFFYAGHAAQDEMGVNYLLPTDATMADPASVRRQGWPLQALINDMYEANNLVNVLIVDACADWFAGDTSRDRRRGLSELRYRGNMYVASSTAQGETAQEGDGPLSPYTTALVEAMRSRPGDRFSSILDDLTFVVGKSTDNTQTPYFNGGLATVRGWTLRDALVPVAPSTLTVVQPPPLVRTPEFLRTLDRTRLVAFSRGRESFVDTLLARRDLLVQNGIVTPQRLAYFVATIGHESGGFVMRAESLNYSARGLQAVWPRQVPNAEVAASYERQPQRIANLIYANKMGNGDEASGDGWRFRGRGYLMITGRANYRRLGQMVGIDLELQNAPELILDPEVGLAVAAVYWSKGGCNEAADADNLAQVARKFAGASVGMDARRLWLMRARAVLGLPEPPSAEPT